MRGDRAGNERCWRLGSKPHCRRGEIFTLWTVSSRSKYALIAFTELYGNTDNYAPHSLTTSGENTLFSLLATDRTTVAEASRAGSLSGIARPLVSTEHHSLTGTVGARVFGHDAARLAPHAFSAQSVPLQRVSPSGPHPPGCRDVTLNNLPGFNCRVGSSQAKLCSKLWQHSS